MGNIVCKMLLKVACNVLNFHLESKKVVDFDRDSCELFNKLPALTNLHMQIQLHIYAEVIEINKKTEILESIITQNDTNIQRLFKTLTQNTFVKLVYKIEPKTIYKQDKPSTKLNDTQIFFWIVIHYVTLYYSINLNIIIIIQFRGRFQEQMNFEETDQRVMIEALRVAADTLVPKFIPSQRQLQRYLIRYCQVTKELVQSFNLSRFSCFCNSISRRETPEYYI
ncbi:Hypothetical_protein [Hexamita inflata]|uniref:Hypothetical_protein n=1 Tax=Hexamita inflata TaxID=28002 RepID=A0AA86Q066_9EUKA|nr:Hypothetical protein HINF_LOCUS36298 [Hexamita inflata]